MALLRQLESGILIPEEASPATPGAGKVAIYAKSDGLVYSKNDAGDEVPLGGGGGSPAAPIVTSLASGFQQYDLGGPPMLEGTFQPTDTAVDIEVRVSALSQGNAHCPIWFYVGQPTTPGSVLIDNGGGVLAGVTAHAIGDIWFDSSGHAERRIRLTGLDTSKEVTWAIYPAIIGGSSQSTITGAGPARIAITPDGTKAFVGLWTSNSVQPVVLGRFYASLLDQDYGDITRPSIDTGLNPLGVACDNNRAVVCNFNAASASIISVAGERLERTVALAGTPRDVAISPDGTLALVASNNGRVYRIVLATGAVTSFLLGGATDMLAGVAIKPDGTTAYIGNNTTGSVYVFRLSDNTVTSTLSAGAGVIQIRCVSNAYAWVMVGTFGGTWLKRLVTATPAITDNYTLPYVSGGDFAVTKSGFMAYSVFTAGIWAQTYLEGDFAGQTHLIHRGAQTLQSIKGESYGGDVPGVATNDYGEIWIAQFGIDKVWKWPGCTFICDPTNSTLGHFAEVTVDL